MSLLAWTAIPLLMSGAFDRRAATPLMLSLSMKVAACVSISPWTSVATGGDMMAAAMFSNSLIYGEE